MNFYEGSARNKIYERFEQILLLLLTLKNRNSRFRKGTSGKISAESGGNGIKVLGQTLIR